MEYNVEEILSAEELPRFETRSERTVPFPQANSLDCVIDIVLNMEEEGSELYTLIARNVVNSLRQAAYYMNAAIYLGLCKKIADSYYLSGNGLRIKNANGMKRKSLLAAFVLAHPVIGRWYTQVFLFDNKEDRLNFILTGFETPLSSSTKKRRAECVLSWLEWIQKHLPEL